MTQSHSTQFFRKQLYHCFSQRFKKAFQTEKAKIIERSIQLFLDYCEESLFIDHKFKSLLIQIFKCEIFYPYAIKNGSDQYYLTLSNNSPSLLICCDNEIIETLSYDTKSHEFSNWYKFFPKGFINQASMIIYDHQVIKPVEKLCKIMIVQPVQQSKTKNLFHKFFKKI